MWLSRTDVVPVLTIVAGGVVGVLLTLSPLVLMSPADDMSVPVQPTWSPSDDVSRPARPVTARLAGSPSLFGFCPTVSGSCTNPT